MYSTGFFSFEEIVKSTIFWNKYFYYIHGTEVGNISMFSLDLKHIYHFKIYLNQVWKDYANQKRCGPSVMAEEQGKDWPQCDLVANAIEVGLRDLLFWEIIGSGMFCLIPRKI